MKFPFDIKIIFVRVSSNLESNYRSFTTIVFSKERRAKYVNEIFF